MECEREVVDRMADGAAIEDVEDLIDEGEGSQDEKAALWLYAWSLQPPARARYEARKHMRTVAARKAGPIYGTD